MKTHIRMIIASAIVIALALTAVSGITYSWFSDTESTNISVTTATMDLKVVVDTDGIFNTGEINGTDVTFTNSLGVALDGSVENATNIAVSYLCANTHINIPYTIKYKSDINTVARVTATVSVSVEDATGVNSALGKITLGFNGTSKELANITGTGYYGVDGKKTFEGTADLLPWTVNTATTGTDYVDLLTDNNLTISTDKGLTLEGLTFTITLNSEIYQKSYVYTSYTHAGNNNILYTENDDGEIVYFDSKYTEVHAVTDADGKVTYQDANGNTAVGEVTPLYYYTVYDIPANRMVSFDKVVYCTTGSGESAITHTFTNVLLDFTDCTGFDHFAMNWVCPKGSSSYSDNVQLTIIPFEYAASGTKTYAYSDDGYLSTPSSATGNVTISLNYGLSLDNLRMFSYCDNTVAECNGGILVNSSTSSSSFVVIDVPMGDLRILKHTNLKPA